MPSSIEWTDETWNPVTGCTRVSPGCDHCYMHQLYPRLRAMRVPGYPGPSDQVTLVPDRLAQPRRWRRPRRIFVCSMSDLHHRAVPDDYLAAVYDAMVGAPQHTYQVLTKRPGRLVAWWQQHGQRRYGRWPPWVWVGTSVETQRYAPRLTVLGRVPALVRFVSAEPLLGPLDLRPWLGPVQWVIAGGESGPRARPLQRDWLRTLRDHCVAAHVPFFLKQLGGPSDKRGGARAVLDARPWQQLPALGAGTPR